MITDFNFAVFFAAEAQQPGQFPWLLIAGVMFVWIFLVMIPQSKDKKRRAEMHKALKKGDRVLLQGGMKGKVAAVDNDDVIVEFESGKIRFLKTSVVMLLDLKTAAPAEEKSDKK